MTLTNSKAPPSSSIIEVERSDFEVANYFLNYNRVINHKHLNKLYLWDGGIYKENENEIKNKLVSYFDDIFTEEKYSTTRLRNIIDIIKSRSFVYDEMDGNIINCLNGWLRLENEEWIFREYYQPPIYPIFLSQIPVHYKPEAKCPIIDQIFSDLIGLENVPLLYKMIAYFLMPHIEFQKAFLMHGPPKTGKTTFINIIFKFIGREVISQVRLHDLSKRFMKGFIMNKYINIYDDLDSGALERTDVFRQLVTNEWLSAEIKHCSTMVDFLNRIKLLFSCNNLPFIPKNTGNELFRRVVLIPCFNEIENVDRQLLKKIDENELSGLLNKILLYWLRLEKEGFGEQWEDVELVRDKWEMDTNPIGLFITFGCILDNSARVEYNEFYNKMNEFRVQRGAKPISKTLCTQSLKRIDVLTDNNRKWYKGIKLVGDINLDSF